MKNWFIFTFMFFSVLLWGQSKEDYFIESANLFLNNKNTEALDRVEEGLYKFPNDKKLEALKKKLEEQKEGKQNKEKDQNEKSEKNKNKENKESNENKKKQEQNKASGKEKEKTEEPQTNSDLREEMYNSILKSLEKEEKKTKKRLMRQMGKREYTQKEKDW